ncbi:MAG: phage holin [Oscillospiraceae bacterium]|nr:phage holin [Oscillospiraceae bacterium]
MKIKSETIIRTAVLALALVNQLLSAAGKSVLPIDDEQLSTLLSTAFTAAAALWSWWKNNSFTQQAIEADAYLQALRQDEAAKGEF